jgi:RNA polymerase sigma-70 factor (sigma-E family)
VPAAGSRVELDDTDAEALSPVAGSPRLRLVAGGTCEDVYRAHYGRMVRVARMLTGSNEAAEDIVQDVFVGLYQRFDDIDDAAGYLYRSVVNRCWSRRKHWRVVERRRHLTAQPDATYDEIDETWTALRRLQPRRRAVVVLRYYEDLPLADIAEILGCRVGTVKSMLHRALAELKAELKAEIR